MYYEYIVKAGLWWMLPILVLSVVGTAFGLERGWFWFRFYRRAGRRRELLRSILNDRYDRESTALRLARTRDLTLSPHLVLVKNHGEVALDVAEARSRDRAEEVLRESRKFTGILQFIANLSGTLGLLGTVAGVSMAFEDIALQNPKGLALSLSTAMYTTVGGIFLFLVTYFSVSLFGHFADGLEERLDREINRFREHLDLAGAREPENVA